MTTEEIKLLLTSAQIAFQEEKQSKAINKHWSDWWDEYIKQERPDLSETEIAILLREADFLYDQEAEQQPYLLYLAEFLSKNIN